MMKIELKSRNFEKLQRVSAFSTKSEKIRANFIKISENRARIPAKLTTSGSDPLQSEVPSKVNSNFGAVQDVAQPAAQLADQYFAQPESSP